MRITQEADYALRIASVLATQDKPVGAPMVAAAVHIPPRFCMKILRKLALAGIVCSSRGAAGGYSLKTGADSLSIKQVIEAIDGVLAIRHCLGEDACCTHNPDKSLCRYHRVFKYLNGIISEKLSVLTVADMVNEDLPIDTLIDKIK